MAPHGFIATVVSSSGHRDRPQATSSSAEVEQLTPTSTEHDLISGRQSTASGYGSTLLPSDSPTEQRGRPQGIRGWTASIQEDKSDLDGDDQEAAETEHRQENTDEANMALNGHEEPSDGYDGPMEAIGRNGAPHNSIVYSRRSVERSNLTKTPYTTLVLEQTVLLSLVVLLFSTLLLSLAHYAWPDIGSRQRGDDRTGPESYPHPLAWRPLLLGTLANLGARSMRGGVGLVSSECLDGGARSRATSKDVQVRHTIAVISAIVLHTIVLEASRLLAILLVLPVAHSCCSEPLEYAHHCGLPASATLLQIAYHVGLGFGLGEAGWGIAYGWSHGLLPYKEVLSGRTVESRSSEGSRDNRSCGMGGLPVGVADDNASGTASSISDRELPGGVGKPDLSVQLEEEEGFSAEPEADEVLDERERDLVEKIAALDRMRQRAELESALGIPYSDVNVAIHILWRVDSVLLNLGITLVVAAFYSNADLLYSHRAGRGHEEERRGSRPSKWLPLVLLMVTFLHGLISLGWAFYTKKFGLGAMSWGSLIVSLGAVFAGLGCWGALV